VDRRTASTAFPTRELLLFAVTDRSGLEPGCMPWSFTCERNGNHEMTTTMPFELVQPPHAEQHPRSDTRHGITRTDEYAWMRAENWQEVFRDPSTLDPAIRAHLEAENSYQERLMADTVELRKILFAEM